MIKTVLFCLLCFFGLAVQAQSDTTLKEYTGIYVFPAGSATPSMDITLQGAELLASATIGSASLKKISRDTFSIPSYNGMVYFSRNEAGKIKGIRVEVESLILIGNKEELMPVALFRRQRVLVSR
jgi:hypothetical protein